jgi:hypothetical protein
MLVIDSDHSREYFARVTKFAADTQQEEFLWDRLLYLHHFRDPEIPRARKYWCRTCEFGYIAGPGDAEASNWEDAVPACPSCHVGKPKFRSKVIEGDRGMTAGITRCKLCYDSAPASFSFILDTWTDGAWRFMMNGGLIYHGRQTGWALRNGYVIKDGEGVPNFSVRFGDDSPNPWSVHT